jgi:hypothetical protein
MGPLTVGFRELATSRRSRMFRPRAGAARNRSIEREPARASRDEQHRRILRFRAVLACSGVKWRAMADEDGQYCFALAL